MESHEIIVIGVNLAHRSFHSDRREVIGEVQLRGIDQHAEHLRIVRQLDGAGTPAPQAPKPWILGLR